MSRPNLPDSEKRRTIPLRMGKPDYRALLLIMKVTDKSIQEHMRIALNEYLERQLPALRTTLRSVLVPHPYELGSWSDDRFSAWLDEVGEAVGEAAPAPAKPARSSFRRSVAA